MRSWAKLTATERKQGSGWTKWNHSKPVFWRKRFLPKVKNFFKSHLQSMFSGFGIRTNLNDRQTVRLYLVDCSLSSLLLFFLSVCLHTEMAEGFYFLKSKKIPVQLFIERGQINPGNFLLSHILANAVPLTSKGLTTVFGMGTGVTPSVWLPEILSLKYFNNYVR